MTQTPIKFDSKIYVITAEKLTLGGDPPYTDDAKNNNNVYFDAWTFQNINTNRERFNNHVLLAYIYIDFKFTSSMKYNSDRNHSTLNFFKKYWFGHIIYNPNNDAEKCIIKKIASEGMELDDQSDKRHVINITNLSWEKNLTFPIINYYKTKDNSVKNELKAAYGDECLDETEFNNPKFIVPVCMKFTIL